jgi:ATP-dependent DNA helicase MPH1
MVRKTGKTWDRATAARQAAKAAKGKGRGRPGWDDEDEDEAGNGADDDGEDGSFDQFPAPAIALGELPAEMKHALDVEAAQTWVYPVNLPLRDYQFNIVRAALFRNTLAALPTGLGKTFIAGCVMLNYARWYPTAKIFFVAPTKPLVNQQAQAFPETCGFLNSKITVLNGDTSGDKREQLYPTKQVFFMTAQTMMNDLSNGRLDPRDVVLLVVGALGSLIFVGPRATSLVAHRC